MQNTHADLVQVIHDYMSDAETDWMIGEHAVFSRDVDDEVDVTLDFAGGLIVTDKAAVRIAAAGMIRLVPAEGLTDDLWIQAGLLCLREGDAGMSKRSVLTELGNDLMAARPIGQLGTLFDLGIGDPQVDLCIRTADESLCALLRKREGTKVESDDAEIFDAAGAAGADFVTSSRLGRIETFGRRTVPDTPLGLDAPSGYVTCLSFAPPRPRLGEAFDEATYGAFRVLHGIFADPALVRLKQNVSDAMRRGDGPETIDVNGDEACLVVRVLLRQLAQRDGTSDTLRAWSEAFGA